MSGKLKSRGVSLVEVIFALLIASVLLGMTAVSLRGSLTQEGPRGLAYALAEDLRATRAEAQRSGELVAACFPNDDGRNPFSSSFVSLRGEQLGHLHHSFAYGGEFDGRIFAGTWPGFELETFDVTPGWQSRTRGHYALYFRPDGTVFSNNLPSHEGRYALVTGSAFEASSGSSGSLATLSAASFPYTVNISKSGTISVSERKVPGDQTMRIARGLPAAAPAVFEAVENVQAPVIKSVEALPKRTQGLSTAGVGRTYVQIHPLQRTGKRVEFGLATFQIRAEDAEGGPLEYRMSASASSGEAGTFSHLKSDDEDQETGVAQGRMKLVQDESGDRVWQSIVSWRPPPGALPSVDYEFKVEVTDPDGNVTVMESGGETFPSFSTLSPPRVVMQTAAGELVMSNVDGNSIVNLTRDFGKEHNPFFSSDGTILYSFNDPDSDTVDVIARNADGTDRRVIRSFPRSEFRDIAIDPFYTYAAYLTDNETEIVFSNKLLSRPRPVKSLRTVGSGDDKKTVSFSQDFNEYYLGPQVATEVDGFRLMLIHLNTGKEVKVADYTSAFKWYGSPKYSLRYNAKSPFDPDTDKISAPAQGHGDFNPVRDYVPFPGYADVEGQVRVNGFPPKLVNTSLPPLARTDEIFNLSAPDWYVQWNGRGGKGSLTLGRASVSGSGSKKQFVPQGVAEDSVSWTPDGLSVVYARNVGDGHRVYEQKLLELQGTELIEQIEKERLLFSYAGVSSPRVSADGQFVFFMHGAKVFRVPITDGTSGVPVEVSRLVDQGITAFVLSR